jgi:sigma-54 interacting transcriptional regulator/FHA domain-containing protein/regulatory Fis family protein
MRGHGNTTTQAFSADLPMQALAPVPGALLIFAGRRPRSRVFRWEGSALELGRVELAEDDVGDPLISRKHLRLVFDGTAWQASDLGSRNGTFVAGERLTGTVSVAAGSVIRVGGALLLALSDILGVQRYGLGIEQGVVGGPALRKALESVAFARKADLLPSLLISGESGSGKEIAARVFHESGPQPGAPFVAVNCATIPADIAERLLFGSRRGAFSGATDAPGHVQAAHGGTLFLDEVAELSLDVQTKLLRMLETREVLRLGATSPEHVDVRVCAATWRDLRQEVAGGRFREDLYFRIGQPEIRLPPLRERIEEIPWHTQHLLDHCGAARQLEASAGFVEACAARVWPGNVRELRAEVRRAAAACAQEARPLAAEDLAPRAGMPITRETAGTPSASYPEDEISAALRAEEGNVLAAARRLGIHRNKVRRWLERFGLDARQFKAERR